MSRLHTVQCSAEAVAEQFGAEMPPDLIMPPETVEGFAGLAIFEANGRLQLRRMTWGFPRWTREVRLRGDPPGRAGLVADLTNPIWDTLAVDPRYRCLIPITHFANPDGEPGSKTRTWFSLDGQPIAAWAGFCRNTPEFGPVYAGMTMTANDAVMPTNDRMPVLLEPGEHGQWLHGSIRDVIAFQFREPVAAERMIVEATGDAWRSGKPPKGAQAQLLFD